MAGSVGRLTWVVGRCAADLSENRWRNVPSFENWFIYVNTIGKSGIEQGHKESVKKETNRIGR